MNPQENVPSHPNLAFDAFIGRLKSQTLKRLAFTHQSVFYHAVLGAKHYTTWALFDSYSKIILYSNLL